MKRHRAALDAYADEVIQRVEATHHDDDVLGALLIARPKGTSLTRRQLRSRVPVFFAGNETTAAALSWALVHGASTNPEEWARLRERPADHTLPFVTESLRLNPAVWGIPRTPTRAGVALTAGEVTTRVRRGQLANIYVRGINRDPRVWDDPLRFDPSRHTSDAPETGTKEARRALLPFGLGSRGCIGQHLAMAELTAVLPALAAAREHGHSRTSGGGCGIRASGAGWPDGTPRRPPSPGSSLNGRTARRRHGRTRDARGEHDLVRVLGRS